jgi:hypothetical protein
MGKKTFWTDLDTGPLIVAIIWLSIAFAGFYYIEAHPVPAAIRVEAD